MSYHKTKKGFVLLIIILSLFIIPKTIASEFPFKGTQNWICNKCGETSEDIIDICPKCGKSIEKNKVYISVDFKENLLFSKYGINILIDGIQINELRHGENYYQKVRLPDGNHEIKLVKEDDQSVYVSDNIEIYCDGLFQCQIETKTAGIELRNNNWIPIKYQWDVSYGQRIGNELLNYDFDMYKKRFYKKYTENPDSVKYAKSESFAGSFDRDADKLILKYANGNVENFDLIEHSTPILPTNLVPEPNIGVHKSYLNSDASETVEHETYSPPLIAKISLSDHKNRDLCYEPFVEMKQSGQYVIEWYGSEHVVGIHHIELKVTNFDEHDVNPINLENHYIKIDKVLVDDKSAILANSYTYKRSGTLYDEPYLRLEVPLYKEKNDEDTTVGFSWNGESTIGEKGILNSHAFSDLTSFKNLKIYFTYGRFHKETENAISSANDEQQAYEKPGIMIDTTEISLAIGKSMKIIPKIQDLPKGESAPKFEWNSSNNGVATVKNGQVTAVSKGTAVITCWTTLSNGELITCDCKVKTYVPVATISVNKKKIEVGIGESALQKTTIKPDDATDKSVSYSSSNTDVVAVQEDGSLVAKKAGNAVITVSANDGSGVKQNYSVHVSDVYVSKENETISVGDIISFGNYDQMPIEWVVLERKDNTLILISKDILAFKPFHDKPGGSYWPKSSIRKWLNSDFFTSAFKNDEQKAIKTVNHKSTIESDDGPRTLQSNDRVFLLDRSEAKRYFSLYDYLGNITSDYEYADVTVKFRDAAATYSANRSKSWHYLSYPWWLRTSVSWENFTSYINAGMRYFETHYQTCDNTDCGIRPAIIVDIKKARDYISLIH